MKALMAAAKGPRGCGLLGKLSLSAATFVVLFGLGEGIYRIRAGTKRREFLAGRDPGTLVTRAAPPPLYYALKPDYPGFSNDYGFRDLDRQIVKPEGVYRIAVLGDSLSMQGALPFEQLYLRRLQHRFDSELPGRVEILNFGITGYNTEQETALLHQHALKYEPDLILWQFHDNDAQHAIYGGTLGAFYYRPESYFANTCRQ